MEFDCFRATILISAGPPKRRIVALMAIREKLIAPSLLLYLATFVNCSFDSGNTLEGTGLPLDADVTVVDAEVGEDDANVSVADASPDATVIIPDAAVPSCVGDLLGFDIVNMEDCDPVLPTGPLNLTMAGFRYLLDTSAQTLTRNGVPIPFTRTVVLQTGGSELLVVSAEGFSLGPTVTLNVVGERPLVLISTSSIELAGTILVNADGVLSGAGGDKTEDCGNTGRGGVGVVQADDSNNQGGSGGGGGGFGGDGGEGAKIDEANNNANPTSEGFENGGDLIVPLRGGCSGGAGGGNGPGQGGGAGGAIQLVAKFQLQVSGTISAAGGGGRGTSQTNSGGGGGGSGGAILLQGSPVQLSGRLLVNGGGGGEGSRGGTGSGAGQDGSSQFITAAPGGAAGSSGSSSGGDGGAGGGAGVEGQNSVEINPEDGNEGSANMQSGAAGGGGGGGGVGRFRVVQS